MWTIIGICGLFATGIPAVVAASRYGCFDFLRPRSKVDRMQKLFTKYLDNAMAYFANEVVDERFMRPIEIQLGVKEKRVNEFRKEMLARCGNNMARHGQWPAWDDDAAFACALTNLYGF